MIEKPDAIMMKIPDSFFEECQTTYDEFVKYYVDSTNADPTWCFYHFINKVPVHKVLDCFICFGGKVQMKVRIVEFLKMQPVHIASYHHDEPRNWMIGAGPVIVAPFEIPSYKGRGFRYTKNLF